VYEKCYSLSAYNCTFSYSYKYSTSIIEIKKTFAHTVLFSCMAEIVYVLISFRAYLVIDSCKSHISLYTVLHTDKIDQTVPVGNDKERKISKMRK
jgi:hypothetical protein